MSHKSGQNSLVLFWLICIIYFFTGLTALSYEVLWARILSTLFGVSIFGVVVTISAFLAGLGVGSIVGKKYLYHFTSPLRVFAFLEIIVALFAFNLPGILTGVDAGLESFSDSSFTQWIFIQAVTTFLLMFIPAFALGFGFPMILATLKNSRINVGTVYALNTLGGVLGALLPLLLLPLAGWTVSVRLVAIFAIIMAVSALAISFFLKTKAHETESSEKFDAKPDYKTLIIYACIGAAAIMLEIAWTRLYGMILLRTEYVMAIILATFLVGIGFGSLFAARIKSINGLFILPLLVSISALLSLYTLPFVSEWAEIADFNSLSQAMIMQGLIVALITLPATLAFGAWFPMLISLFSEKIRSSSSLYGFNSIGAASGGLIAGFLVLPTLGTAPLIFLSTLLVLLVSIHWLKHIYYKVFILAVFVISIPVIQLPSIEKLLPASQANAKNLSFYEDAMSLTHVVENDTGEKLLLADLQRMDASSEPTAVRVQKNQARLPLLLHPDPKKVLFLGLGTGITASGALPIENLEITAVELSNGAIRAAQNEFSQINNNIGNQINIVRDDARRFLKASESNYDVIIGDLFHPDLIGRSELLSLQQFQRAKNRLDINGVFVQWLALNQFDLETLKVVLATFNQVFPEAVLFMDGFRLAMVGVDGKFAGMRAIKKNLATLTSENASDLSGGEGLWSWAARYWGPIQNVAQDKIQDEWAPIIEFQLPKAKFNRQNHLQSLLNYLMRNRQPVAKAKIDMRVSSDEEPYFEQARMASDMYFQSWMESFASNPESSQKLLSMAFTANPDDQWIGFGIADAMFASLDQAQQQGINKIEALNKILAVRSDHLGALKMLREVYLHQGKSEKVVEITLKIKEISPLEKI